MDELQVDEIAVGEKVNLINLGEFRAHFLSPMYRLKLTDESCTFSRWRKRAELRNESVSLFQRDVRVIYKVSFWSKRNRSLRIRPLKSRPLDLIQ